MKKTFLSLVMTVISLSLFAQKGETSIGLNLGYGTDSKNLAIGARFNYCLTDHIRLAPSFNYFLKKDGLSALEVNADVHYLLNITDRINVYPLVGLTYTNWEFSDRFSIGDEYIDVNSSATRIGVNVGAGIGYNLSKHLMLGFELKYSVISDLDQLIPTLYLSYKF